MSEYGHKVQVWSADWDAAHARISALEAALRKIIDEGDYTAPEGMKRIARTALETTGEPVGICGTCDDVHDSGYYDHNFVPKMPDEQGCEYCASLEVNPKCPACNGIER